MSAAATSVRFLVLGHEYAPRSVSLEDGDETVQRLPVTAALVETEIGTILLETGLSPELRDPDEAARFYGERPPEPAVPDPLDGVELAAAAVSHLHVDHTGGLWRAPFAFVQRRELEFGMRAGPEHGYRRADYADVDWRVLDGDAELAPGVRAIFSPGHTPGHMSYLVEDRWLLAVDAIELQENLDRDVPVGSSADPADAPLRRESHDRLKAIAAQTGATIVPGHDPGTWERLATRPARR